ncbi:hypothetical protein V8F20_011194 [Naviculisporaceae sp. PSN 640]
MLKALQVAGELLALFFEPKLVLYQDFDTLSLRYEDCLRPCGFGSVITKQKDSPTSSKALSYSCAEDISSTMKHLDQILTSGYPSNLTTSFSPEDVMLGENEQDGTYEYVDEQWADHEAPDVEDNDWEVAELWENQDKKEVIAEESNKAEGATRKANQSHPRPKSSSSRRQEMRTLLPSTMKS